MATPRSLLGIAYGYFSQGEPFPMDLQMSLNSVGLDPDCVEEAFQEGQAPSDILKEEINNG